MVESLFSEVVKNYVDFYHELFTKNIMIQTKLKMNCFFYKNGLE